MATLYHTAPLPARINNKMPQWLDDIFIVGGGAIGFFSFIGLLFILAMGYPAPLWLFFIIIVSTLLAVIDDQAFRSYKRNIVKSSHNPDLHRVTKAYWTLNKDHRKMAKPLMDRIVTESEYSGAFTERAQRIYALQAREETERPKITKDDSDLYQIDSYLDMPVLEA